MTFLRSSNSKKRGFTMIELLVVVTIMIMLTAVGLVSYQNAGRNARNAKRKADLEQIRSALVLYRSDNGYYPTGNFITMLDTLNDDGYISSTSFEDPKDGTLNYTYIYSAAGAQPRTFELSTYLEPDPGIQYILENP